MILHTVTWGWAGEGLQNQPRSFPKSLTEVYIWGATCSMGNGHVTIHGGVKLDKKWWPARTSQTFTLLNFQGTIFGAPAAAQLISIAKGAGSICYNFNDVTRI